MKKVIIFISLITSIFILNNKVYAYQYYKIGDKVTYNDIDFYVIKDSSSDSDYVTLLKKEPLTVDEVNLYGGVGTANNHVNMYIFNGFPYYQAAYDSNGYGGMAYYLSETCGYVNNNTVYTGCTTDFEESEVKYVVDAWKTANAPAATEVRLITFDDLTENLGFELQQVSPTSQAYTYTANTPSWVYNSNYSYWTMSRYNDSASDVWNVSNDGSLSSNNAYDYGIVVRPVIIISKSALPVDDDNQDNEIIDDNNKEQSVIDNTVESKQSVTVPNTLRSVSGLIILIGMVLVCVGLNIFIIVKNRSHK